MTARDRVVRTIASRRPRSSLPSALSHRGACPSQRRQSWRVGVVVLVLLVGSSSVGVAQDRREFQQWSALLASASSRPEAPGLFFWFDLHARRGDPGTVVLVRPAVGVEITPWLNVLGGYVWIPRFDDATGTSSHEHRLWEQVVLKHRFDDAGIFVQSRTRLEQRFSAGDDGVAWRLREFVRVNWHPRREFPVGVALWDEVFVGLSEQDWAPRGFDQNRVFLGPFLQMASWARLEVGYLLAFLDRGDNDLFAHALAVNLFLTPRPAGSPVPPSS